MMQNRVRTELRWVWFALPARRKVQAQEVKKALACGGGFYFIFLLF